MVSITLSIVNPSNGIPIASSSALITSIAIFITNEHFGNYKKRYTNLRPWIIVFSLLYEKILKQSMLDEEIDDEEAQELKNVLLSFFGKKELL